jgi:hypothetical protein
MASPVDKRFILRPETLKNAVRREIQGAMWRPDVEIVEEKI